MFSFLDLSHSLAAAMASMARLDAFARGAIRALRQAGVKREDVAKKVRKKDGKRPSSAQALLARTVRLRMSMSENIRGNTVRRP